MHKQRARRNRGERERWRNANFRLPESAKQSLLTLFSECEGGAEGSFDLGYLVSEYLSKLCLPGKDEADLRRSRAIEKWIETERRNAITNTRLRERDPGFNILPRVTRSSFLRFATRLVSDILGPLRDEVVLGSLSGGASTSRNRTVSNPAYKYVGQADVTMEAAPFVSLIHSLSGLFREYQVFDSVTVVESAVLFTVPKKTDIDRCACKEPDVNMFLQKGVGKHIRSRLRKFGINLNDQSINRRFAKLGSETNHLATLDLSSASDTVTIELVRALLPSDWFEYLDSIRSQSVDVDGHVIRTEMFSSMGNGFTFELESLIFYVLMRTVAYFEGSKGIISVYGDDIIIPSGMYDMAVFVLAEFGFSVNEDKSFSTGPFRESCGGHYHYGVDVTPFYLKREPTHLTDIIRVANQLRRWTFADESRQYVYPFLYDLWSKLAGYVPKSLWGGRDYDVDTQLVSPGPPKMRLNRMEKPLRPPVVGQYVMWHVTNRNRTEIADDSAVSFSELSEATKLCRLRRAIPGAPYLDHEFFQEL